MSSDHSKMVISTSEGYLMVIHDLDLRTLNEDLKDFQSDLYRLMQKVSNGYDHRVVIFQTLENFQKFPKIC